MQEVKQTNAYEKVNHDNQAEAKTSEEAVRDMLNMQPPPKKIEISKIDSIRNALEEISRKEEEEEISARIIENVRIARDRKENPKKYAAEERARLEALHRHHRRRSQKHTQGIGGVILRKGDSGSEIFRKSLFWFSVCVFIGCIIWMCAELISRFQTEQKYDDIISQYQSSQHKTTTSKKTEQDNIESDETSEIEFATEEATYELLPGAENLLELSDDVVGYITIPDTVINYPVMQNLDDSEGEEYFLYHDFYGENSNLGSIFLDFRCSFDVVGEDKKLVRPTSENLIIYGHNMKNESMFGSLKHYKDDETYYEKHPLIELNSNYQQYTFKIYGYFIADALDTTDTRFEYWNYIELDDEESFYDYVNEVKRRTLRLTNVDVEYGDMLLTLSTCSSAVSNGRLVVCARALREGEDPYEGVEGSVPNPNIKWPTIHRDSSKYDPNAEFVPYG